MDYPYKKGWCETKDHKKLKIKDMETSHIDDTIILYGITQWQLSNLFTIKGDY